MKITRLRNKPAFSKNNSNKSAYEKNDKSKPASIKNNGNNEDNRFGISKNVVEYAKKSKKLSKSRKSKSKKTSKSQNLVKSGKTSQKVETQLILKLQKLNQSF